MHSRETEGPELEIGKWCTGPLWGLDGNDG